MDPCERAARSAGSAIQTPDPAAVTQAESAVNRRKASARASGVTSSVSANQTSGEPSKVSAGMPPTSPDSSAAGAAGSELELEGPNLNGLR